MFNLIIKFLMFWAFKNRLFGIFLDGTVKDILTYGESGKQSLKEFITQSEAGFIEIKSSSAVTRKLQSFKDLIANRDEWETFQRNVMDRYFIDPIDMFPYDKAKLTLESVDDDHSLLLDRDGLSKPDEFYKIQLERIERRFPGGRAGTIGDQDVRDLVSTLRLVFRENFSHLVMTRRSYPFRFGLVMMLSLILWTSLIFFGMTAEHYTYSISSIGTLLNFVNQYKWWFIAAHTASAVIMIGFYMMRVTELSRIYKQSMTSSCKTTVNWLNTRLNELVWLVQLVLKEGDNGREDAWVKDAVREWTGEVTKWYSLAFWLAARVEHMEFYSQVEMWLIRRIHYGMRVMGRSITALMFFTISAIMLGLCWFFYEQSKTLALSPSGYWPFAMLFGVTYALILFMLWQSNRLAVPSINLIKDTLLVKDLQGYKDIKLHLEFAELVQREKRRHLIEEEKNKGH